MAENATSYGYFIITKPFDLVEQVQNYNLVCHMWKFFKNWLQEWTKNDAALKILARILAQNFAQTIG